MTTGSNRDVKTAPAAHARLRIFQSTRRPVPLEDVFKTKWGTVRIKARLGQQHADVLEAICYSHERKKVQEDGSIKLLVDPGKVRRLSRQSGGIGYNSAGKSTTLQRILDDLQQAIVDIIEPSHLAGQGQVIGHVDRAYHADGTPITKRNPLKGDERPMWSVTLGPVLSRLVEADIWLGYNPAPIAELRHGISQAVARHVLTHKVVPTGGWLLDTLIKDVAGELDTVSLRHRRRELREDVGLLMETLGISVDGDRVTRIAPVSVQQSRGREA